MSALQVLAPFGSGSYGYHLITNGLFNSHQHEHGTDTTLFPLTSTSLHFSILTLNIIPLIRQELRITLVDLLVPVSLCIPPDDKGSDRFELLSAFLRHCGGGRCRRLS